MIKKFLHLIVAAVSVTNFFVYGEKSQLEKEIEEILSSDEEKEGLSGKRKLVEGEWQDHVPEKTFYAASKGNEDREATKIANEFIQTVVTRAMRFKGKKKERFIKYLASRTGVEVDPENLESLRIAVAKLLEAEGTQGAEELEKLLVVEKKFGVFEKLKRLFSRGKKIIVLGGSVIVVGGLVYFGVKKRRSKSRRIGEGDSKKISRYVSEEEKKNLSLVAKDDPESLISGEAEGLRIKMSSILLDDEVGETVRRRLLEKGKLPSLAKKFPEAGELRQFLEAVKTAEENFRPEKGGAALDEALKFCTKVYDKTKKFGLVKELGKVKQKDEIDAFFKEVDKLEERKRKVAWIVAEEVLSGIDKCKDRPDKDMEIAAGVALRLATVRDTIPLPSNADLRLLGSIACGRDGNEVAMVFGELLFELKKKNKNTVEWQEVAGLYQKANDEERAKIYYLLGTFLPQLGVGAAKAVNLVHNNRNDLDPLVFAAVSARFVSGPGEISKDDLSGMLGVIEFQRSLSSDKDKFNDSLLEVAELLESLRDSPEEEKKKEAQQIEAIISATDMRTVARKTLKLAEAYRKWASKSGKADVEEFNSDFLLPYLNAVEKNEITSGDPANYVGEDGKFKKPETRAERAARGWKDEVEDDIAPKLGLNSKDEKQKFLRLYPQKNDWEVSWLKMLVDELDSDKKEMVGKLVKEAAQKEDLEDLGSFLYLHGKTEEGNYHGFVPKLLEIFTAKPETTFKKFTSLIGNNTNKCNAFRDVVEALNGKDKLNVENVERVLGAMGSVVDGNQEAYLKAVEKYISGVGDFPDGTAEKLAKAVDFLAANALQSDTADAIATGAVWLERVCVSSNAGCYLSTNPSVKLAKWLLEARDALGSARKLDDTATSSMKLLINKIGQKVKDAESREILYEALAAKPLALLANYSYSEDRLDVLLQMADLLAWTKNNLQILLSWIKGVGGRQDIERWKNNLSTWKNKLVQLKQDGKRIARLVRRAWHEKFNEIMQVVTAGDIPQLVLNSLCELPWDENIPDRLSEESKKAAFLAMAKELGKIANRVNGDAKWKKETIIKMKKKVIKVFIWALTRMNAQGVEKWKNLVQGFAGGSSKVNLPSEFGSLNEKQLVQGFFAAAGERNIGTLQQFLDKVVSEAQVPQRRQGRRGN